MSIGFFLGVAKSYPSEFASEAQSFVDAINAALADRQLPKYVDSSPEHTGHGMGRSSLDHFGAGGLSRFVSFASTNDCSAHFDVAGPRDVYLPLDFDAPLIVPFGKLLWFTRKARVGSAPRLLAGLKSLADPLGIPLVDGELDDGIARLICDHKPLTDNDSALDVTTLEDLRPAWLLYHEAAVLAVNYQCALTLSA